MRRSMIVDVPFVGSVEPVVPYAVYPAADRDRRSRSRSSSPAGSLGTAPMALVASDSSVVRGGRKVSFDESALFGSPPGGGLLNTAAPPASVHHARAVRPSATLVPQRVADVALGRMFGAYPAAGASRLEPAAAPTGTQQSLEALEEERRVMAGNMFAHPKLYYEMQQLQRQQQQQQLQQQDQLQAEGYQPYMYQMHNYAAMVAPQLASARRWPQQSGPEGALLQQPPRHRHHHLGDGDSGGDGNESIPSVSPESDRNASPGGGRGGPLDDWPLTAPTAAAAAGGTGLLADAIRQSFRRRSPQGGHPGGMALSAAAPAAGSPPQPLLLLLSSSTARAAPAAHPRDDVSVASADVDATAGAAGGGRLGWVKQPHQAQQPAIPTADSGDFAAVGGVGYAARAAAAAAATTTSVASIPFPTAASAAEELRQLQAALPPSTAAESLPTPTTSVHTAPPTPLPSASIQRVAATKRSAPSGAIAGGRGAGGYASRAAEAAALNNNATPRDHDTTTTAAAMAVAPPPRAPPPTTATAPAPSARPEPAVVHQQQQPQQLQLLETAAAVRERAMAAAARDEQVLLLRAALLRVHGKLRQLQLASAGVAPAAMAMPSPGGHGSRSAERGSSTGRGDGAAAAFLLSESAGQAVVEAALRHHPPPHVGGLPNRSIPLHIPVAIPQQHGYVYMLETTERTFLKKAWKRRYLVADDRGLVLYRDEDDFKRYAYHKAVMALQYRQCDHFAPSFSVNPGPPDQRAPEAGGIRLYHPYAVDEAAFYFGFVVRQPVGAASSGPANPALLLRTESHQEHLDWVHFLARQFNIELYKDLFPSLFPQPPVAAAASSRSTPIPSSSTAGGPPPPPLVPPPQQLDRSGAASGDDLPLVASPEGAGVPPPPPFPPPGFGAFDEATQTPPADAKGPQGGGGSRRGDEEEGQQFSPPPPPPPDSSPPPGALSVAAVPRAAFDAAIGAAEGVRWPSGAAATKDTAVGPEVPWEELVQALTAPVVAAAIASAAATPAARAMRANAAEASDESEEGEELGGDGKEKPSRRDAATAALSPQRLAPAEAAVLEDGARKMAALAADAVEEAAGLRNEVARLEACVEALAQDKQLLASDVASAEDHAAALAEAVALAHGEADRLREALEAAYTSRPPAVAASLQEAVAQSPAEEEEEEEEEQRRDGLGGEGGDAVSQIHPAATAAEYAAVAAERDALIAELQRRHAEYARSISGMCAQVVGDIDAIHEGFRQEMQGLCALRPTGGGAPLVVLQCLRSSGSVTAAPVPTPDGNPHVFDLSCAVDRQSLALVETRGSRGPRMPVVGNDGAVAEATFVAPTVLPTRRGWTFHDAVSDATLRLDVEVVPRTTTAPQSSAAATAVGAAPPPLPVGGPSFAWAAALRLADNNNSSSATAPGSASPSPIALLHHHRDDDGNNNNNGGEEGSPAAAGAAARSFLHALGTQPLFPSAASAGRSSGRGPNTGTPATTHRRAAPFQQQRALTLRGPRVAHEWHPHHNAKVPVVPHTGLIGAAGGANGMGGMHQRSRSRSTASVA